MKVKLLVVILLFLCALSSFVGYLVLNRLIISGSLKVAAGQIQIAAGQKRLSSGKERLASGERELASGKRAYGTGEKALLAAATVFPPTLAVMAVTGVGSHSISGKLAEGDRQVAAGRKKVRDGEQRLAEGRDELARGISQLNRAKSARNACGISTALLAALTLVLAYRWRRSLFRRS